MNLILNICLDIIYVKDSNGHEIKEELRNKCIKLLKKNMNYFKII